MANGPEYNAEYPGTTIVSLYEWGGLVDEDPGDVNRALARCALRTVNNIEQVNGGTAFMMGTVAMGAALTQVSGLETDRSVLDGVIDYGGDEYSSLITTRWEAACAAEAMRIRSDPDGNLVVIANPVQYRRIARHLHRQNVSPSRVEFVVPQLQNRWRVEGPPWTRNRSRYMLHSFMHPF